MATFYSYSESARQKMTDWLIDYGTGYDWASQAGQLTEDPNDAFRNRIIITWVIKDDSFAVMFKMMFSEHLFNSPLELHTSFMAKRHALGLA